MDFLSTKKAAEYLGISKYSLDVWRVYGKGPRFLKMNRIVRYREKDLLEFVEKSLRTSTTEAKK